MPLHCRRRRLPLVLAGRRTNLHAKTSQMMRSQRQFSLWRPPPQLDGADLCFWDRIVKVQPEPRLGRSINGPPLQRATWRGPWGAGWVRRCRSAAILGPAHSVGEVGDQSLETLSSPKLANSSPLVRSTLVRSEGVDTVREPAGRRRAGPQCATTLRTGTRGSGRAGERSAVRGSSGRVSSALSGPNGARERLGGDQG